MNLDSKTTLSNLILETALKVMRGEIDYYNLIHINQYIALNWKKITTTSEDNLLTFRKYQESFEKMEQVILIHEDLAS